MYVCGIGSGKMTKRGTEAVIPKIRERAKVSLNDYDEDGREAVGSCEPAGGYG